MLLTPYSSQMRTRSCISCSAHAIAASVWRISFTPTYANAWGFAHWVKSTQPFDGSMRMICPPRSIASATTVINADDLPVPVLPQTTRCGVLFNVRVTVSPRSSTPMRNVRVSAVLTASQSALTLRGNGPCLASSMSNPRAPCSSPRGSMRPYT